MHNQSCHEREAQFECNIYKDLRNLESYIFAITRQILLPAAAKHFGKIECNLSQKHTLK